MRNILFIIGIDKYCWLLSEAEGCKFSDEKPPLFGIKYKSFVNFIYYTMHHNHLKGRYGSASTLHNVQNTLTKRNANFVHMMSFEASSSIRAVRPCDDPTL